MDSQDAEYDDNGSSEKSIQEYVEAAEDAQGADDVENA